ncbi:hypothetical protein VNI00_016299 [Paramarasmius palmivorus]|uniref:Uncharacterized protein n=1 Tax=Paramarasmius palmivorus TaxID=297713 RepID=A0AAW0BD14_9AGAR
MVEIPPEEAARISSTFASHRRLLDSFQSSLPQLSPTTDPIFGIVLFVLALSQVSIIHLNAPLFGKDATCTEASIQAARKCVKLLTSPDVEAYFRQPGAGARINPLWGYILKTVSDILKVNNEDSEMLEKSIELLSICSGGSGLIQYNWELAA